jgi:hypothetical protein
MIFAVIALALVAASPSGNDAAKSLAERTNALGALRHCLEKNVSTGVPQMDPGSLAESLRSRCRLEEQADLQAWMKWSAGDRAAVVATVERSQAQMAEEVLSSYQTRNNGSRPSSAP